MQPHESYAHLIDRCERLARTARGGSLEELWLTIADCYRFVARVDGTLPHLVVLPEPGRTVAGDAAASAPPEDGLAAAALQRAIVAAPPTQLRCGERSQPFGSATP